ncbi:MAG: 50S ribosomal protein L10 [Candidatus Magasanikbacteria bacterium]|nr:50S ribosomal protein L10 [Candidatus Magasanikbacteria bacterium]
MAKTRVQKEEAVKSLTQDMQQAKSTVFANFQGLKVSEMEELRGICREQNVDCTATKKTLLKRALDSVGMEVDTKAFEGGVGVFLGKEDEVAPAQLIAKFAKDHDVVKIFGGILENDFIDEAKVLELSKLPSKEELYAKVVGSINAPVSGFVNVLAGNLRGLVNVLNGIKENKA